MSWNQKGEPTASLTGHRDHVCAKIVVEETRDNIIAQLRMLHNETRDGSNDTADWRCAIGQAINLCTEVINGTPAKDIINSEQGQIILKG